MRFALALLALLATSCRPAPDLVRLAGIPSLISEFNGAQNATRIVLLLSPT